MDFTEQGDLVTKNVSRGALEAIGRKGSQIDGFGPKERNLGDREMKRSLTPNKLPAGKADLEDMRRVLDERAHRRKEMLSTIRKKCVK